MEKSMAALLQQIMEGDVSDLGAQPEPPAEQKKPVSEDVGGELAGLADDLADALIVAMDSVLSADGVPGANSDDLGNVDALLKDDNAPPIQAGVLDSDDASPDNPMDDETPDGELPTSEPDSVSDAPDGVEPDNAPGDDEEGAEQNPGGANDEISNLEAENDALKKENAALKAKLQGDSGDSANESFGDDEYPENKPDMSEDETNPKVEDDLMLEDDEFIENLLKEDDDEKPWEKKDDEQEPANESTNFDVFGGVSESANFGTESASDSGLS